MSNSGTIDLSQESINASETLTINGNYVGNSGVLNIASVLGGDFSSSNQLIISNGAATSNTSIFVNNLNGLGAVTSEGILVVQALNGATTDTAFQLGTPVSAGPYEYLLYKGGTQPGTSENWYLRSAFIPTPETPVITPTLPPPTPGATPDPRPGAVFYRVETALYSAVKPVIEQVIVSVVSTFNDRRGNQTLLRAAEPLTSNWFRAFGQDTRQTWAGVVAPKFKGLDYGFQGGSICGRINPLKINVITQV